MRSSSWHALGTEVHLLTLDLPHEDAVRVLREELAALDAACSRFRDDSELRRLRPGRQRVSPLLEEAVRAALDAAASTDGLVDPTLGLVLQALGYDRTFRDLPADGPTAVPRLTPQGAWRQVRCRRGVLDLPEGVLLDLGATAKAWAADGAAARLGRELGGSALVNLGGDLAVTGTPPDGGWPVDASGDVVAVHVGGLATSSTRRRCWGRGGARVHHVLDPRTGTSAVTPWHTVSVAAGSCLEANTASTAALVLAAAAPAWLEQRGLPARLVSDEGTTVVGGWPA